EVIRIDGYTPREKLQIAKRYVVSKQLKEANIDESKLSISDNALLAIINSYTRESGVRSLERNIQKIVRKAAVQIVRDDKEIIRVTEANLEKFLGPEKFLFDKLDEEDLIGVVN
ncbi:MAG: endopeptidase La, partial [Gallicola sp.]|nr:endopeptidase La [Gallicola sp.]